MKRIVTFILIAVFVMAGCSAKAECTDALGCVTVAPGESITIAVELTLSGPDAPYGIDALRGVELAIADRGKVLGHPIELVKEDDLCSPEGGQAAAEHLAQNPQVVGVIGATCSGASEKAAKILSDAGMVLISPSSTAASLTADGTHQAGFLRTIQNDKNQSKMVADFAYTALGARTMATISDGEPYADGLQADACNTFEVLGGKCVVQYQIESGTNPKDALTQIAQSKPDVLYYPIYTVDGVAVTRQAALQGLENAALISSDGLLSQDFISQTQGFSDGMYLSGPAIVDNPSFNKNYQDRYGEKPIAAYAMQAYDATMMLFDAIEASSKTSGGTALIPHYGLRSALYATNNYKGLSGTLTCSSLGDCATPNVVIYQVRGQDFVAIYP